MRTMQRCQTAISALCLAGTLVLAAGLSAGADVNSDKNSAPPKDAIVLFNGKDLADWTNRKGGPASWNVQDGYLEVDPRKGDIMTREKFGPDFLLHVEFWLPLMANATGQNRANSGVYLQGRYEIQVLDSYMNKTYADGAGGALYKIIAPNWAAAEERGLSEPKNPCKLPEQWQTYDITFHSPRVDGQGKVTEKGRVTVVHNGATVIDNGAFDKVTGGALDERIGEPGPLLLQDHGAKVRYRNLWLKPLGGR